MKNTTALLAVFAIVGLTSMAFAQPAELGFNLNTIIVNGPTPDRGMLAQNDDGSFENGYCMQYGGIALPDIGSFAECYNNVYITQAEFGFTQVGNFSGQTIDVYVWADDGGLPGNVICSVIGHVIEAPAYWDFISLHLIDMNCCADGDHFIGYWSNWPDQAAGFFVAADETIDSPGGCPLTKLPEGWVPTDTVVDFEKCKALALREWYLDTCPGGNTPTQQTTWGSIKNLY